jgi:6-pyruvoyltetrahydropterin/6-carboxytetrahydropterin synthase
MKITVCKKIGFDAAHFLPDHPGKCKELHGHHWVTEIGVTGELNEDTGMVVDFTLLSEFLKTIEGALDHHLLNDTVGNPTAENIACWIRDRFLEYQSLSEMELVFVKVWETDNSCAILEV